MDTVDRHVADSALARAASSLADRGDAFGSISGSIGLQTSAGDAMLQLRDGRIVDVTSNVGNAELRLRRSGSRDGGAVLPQMAAKPHEAALRWEVIVDDERPLQIPPLDQLDLEWARNLPELPGVELVWSTRVTHTPFGDLVLTFEVKDGRVIAIHPTWREDADVWLVVKLSSVIGARAGRLTIPETLADEGDCSGDIDALLLLAGLQETQAWREARAISPARDRALMLLLEGAGSGLFTALERELT